MIGPDDGAIAAVTNAAELRARDQARQFALGALKLQEPTIDAIKQRMHVAERKLSAFTKTFPNPVALLAVQRLEDPKRAAYHQNIAHAGHYELQTLARVAIQTGDRALGAAVVARLYELPKDKRPFTPHALADRLVGTEHQAMKEAHARVASAYQHAYNRVVAFQTGRSISPVTKVLKGLRDRATDPKEPSAYNPKNASGKKPNSQDWVTENRNQKAIAALPA